MHVTQQRILFLANSTNIANLKLREIGDKVGEPHPQKVKHHLNQLLKKGFLRQDKDQTVISPINSSRDNDELFLSVPILGSANCGQALTFAEEQYEGYLQISKSLIPNYVQNEMFVVKAIGNSMNRANIKNKSIEDGDYVVIDKRPKSSFNGKYVLSIINGMANIKKLISDPDNKQLVLISESSQQYNPIYIHENDFSNYLINGEVIEVIKRPQI